MSHPKSYTCAKCGHQWTARKRGKPPIECPHCRSRNWEREQVRVCLCLNPDCRHRWTPRANAEPKSCPACKSPAKIKPMAEEVLRLMVTECKDFTSRQIPDDTKQALVNQFASFGFIWFYGNSGRVTRSSSYRFVLNELKNRAE